MAQPKTPLATVTSTRVHAPSDGAAPVMMTVMCGLLLQEFGPSDALAREVWYDSVNCVECVKMRGELLPETVVHRKGKDGVQVTACGILYRNLDAQPGRHLMAQYERQVNCKTCRLASKDTSHNELTTAQIDLLVSLCTEEANELAEAEVPASLRPTVEVMQRELTAVFNILKGMK